MPSSIKWCPMPGKIVCEVIGERDTLGKSGLIFRPPTVQQPRTTAKVLAIYEPFINDFNEESESYLKPGDIIIFGKHSGVEVEYGDSGKVIILREQEILTKVEIEKPEDIHELGVAPERFDDLEG